MIWRVTAAIATSLALLLLVLLFRTSDRRERAPALASDLYQADVGDQTRVCFLTVEERSITGGGHRTRLTTTRYQRYRLIALDVESGAVAAEVALGDRYTGDPTPRIIDVAGAELWMWDADLQIRDLASLSVTADGDALRAANPETADVIPDDPGLFRTSSWFEGMTFKGLDARYYEVRGPSRRVTSIDAELDQKSSYGRSWMALSWQPGRTRARGDRLFLNADVDGADWFGLLSDEERDRLSIWSGEPVTAAGEEWRRLYRAPCEREPRDGDRGGRVAYETRLDLDKLKPVGDETFLMGGLLASPRRDAAWRVAEPASWLAMSKPSISKDATWSLTRLGQDGASVWRVETGINDLEKVIDARGFAVLGGYPDYLNLTQQPFELVLIDLRDGGARVFNVATGETRPR